MAVVLFYVAGASEDKDIALLTSLLGAESSTTLVKVSLRFSK